MHLCEESPLPLLIGGDFNEIMSYGEKEGGVDRTRRNMVSFQETVDDHMLHDLGFMGPWYTWERGNTIATRIRERLDRFLCSASWFELYSDFVVDHLHRYKSDHVAIVLRPQTHNTRRKKNVGSGSKLVGYLMRVARVLLRMLGYSRWGLSCRNVSPLWPVTWLGGVRLNSRRSMTRLLKRRNGFFEPNNFPLMTLVVLNVLPLKKLLMTCMINMRLTGTCVRELLKLKIVTETQVIFTIKLHNGRNVIM